MRILALIVAALALFALACKSDGKRGEIAESESSAPASLTFDQNAQSALARLAELESAKDVTCWTSFRQLDWFIAEKTYSEFATLAKVTAVKGLTRAVWARASASAPGQVISAADLRRAADLPEIALPAARVGELATFANDIGLQNFEDYQKTAEHWRVVLSVLQDEIHYSGSSDLKPLEVEALALLANASTTLSLHLLKESGALASADKSELIEGKHVQGAYRAISRRLGLANAPRQVVRLGASEISRRLRPLTRELIDGKIAALKSFNRSSAELMTDLNRVSRVPLTEDATMLLLQDLQSFVHFVAAGFDPMRSDNYLSDGSFASGKLARRAYLDEVHIQNVVTELFPHQILANGDVLTRFMPNPGTLLVGELEPFELKLLDHEMNGVRDSAIHWIALQNVWKEKPFAMDPFAAEYLSEVASMMMTLWIRRAEDIAAKTGVTSIDVAIARRVRDRSYVMVPPRERASASWSAEHEARKKSVMSAYRGALFRDVTGRSGLPTVLGAVEPVEPGAPAASGQFDIQKIMGGGIAVGDLNGDGFADLFLTGEKLGRLYMNRGRKGPGTFDDKTAAWSVPSDLDDGHGALFFDLEGDGDLDLLILRANHPSLILRQTDGRFIDATAELGFATGNGAHVASVFDYDLDGDLDIYVGYYGSDASNQRATRGRNLPSLDGRNGTPNQLWRQESDGHLVEVARHAGVADPGWTLAVGAFDHENDGDLDLYVANDFGANAFFENRGDGTFADRTAVTGTGDRGSGMNVDVSDVNGDGLWDLYVTNIDMFSKRIKVVYPRDESTIDIDASLVRAFQYLSGNKLYVAAGGGEPGGFLSEESARFEPGDRGWGWDASFFDYENDGDDDLYLSNGWIDGSYAGNQKNQMYIHEEGAFFLSSPESAESFAGNSRSVAAVDIDRDGDLDLVVNNFRQPPVVLSNIQRAGKRWIQLALRGQGKNSRAIGARLEISAGDRKVLRHVSAGRGYLSQADTLVSAGVASAAVVDVIVYWPNGEKTTHKGLETGRLHEIVQPAKPSGS